MSRVCLPLTKSCSLPYGGGFIRVCLPRPFSCPWQKVGCLLGKSRLSTVPITTCVIGAEVREIPKQHDTWLKTYGTIDGAAELMHVSWQKLQQVFAVRRQEGSIPSAPCQPQNLQVYTGGPRIPSRLLKASPVDLLVVELASVTRPSKNLEASV